MVNTILRNENYTWTLLQGKKRKLNYRLNKKINIDKEDWIVTENHHEAIISKEKFDKVQEILDNHVTRTNMDGNFETLSGFVKFNDCKGQMILKGGKNKKYYYCTNYFKKKCTSHSVERSKLYDEVLQIINDNKGLNITNKELNDSLLYGLIDVIYINEDKSVKIIFK